MPLVTQQVVSLGGDPAEALYEVKPGEVPGKPGTIIAAGNHWVTNVAATRPAVVQIGC